MGIKFSLSKSNSPDKAVQAVREVKTAESKEDWSEKTHTSWTEHSGFIETTKGAQLAPPPRLDPRTVPRPSAPAPGLSPAMKNTLTVLVLGLGILCGLYANGVFDRWLKPRRHHVASPATAATQPPADPPRMPAQAHAEQAPAVPPAAPVPAATTNH